jgi:hypothetical protein
MVQLYDRDAAVVREVLILLANFIQGDPDAHRDASDLAKWTDKRDTHSAGIVKDHPSLRGDLAGARLRSIVAAIEEQPPRV